MDIHENGRLTPRGRERMGNVVLDGQTPQAVSEAVGVCPRTVGKLVERYTKVKAWPACRTAARPDAKLLKGGGAPRLECYGEARNV
jgi:hypothetical protein